MEPSVFTKIIRGEIPCHKVYEDDQVLAFMDIAPLTEGHVLVVPKQQIDHLWDLEDSIYQRLLGVAKLVANRQRAVLKPSRVVMIVEGFEVAHAHIKLVPANEDLAIVAHKITPPSDEQLADMAQKLSF